MQFVATYVPTYAIYTFKRIHLLARCLPVLGYDALKWDNILLGDCGEYGQYYDLSVPPDKIARYRFEFDSDSYASLYRPEIPDRSQVNIHALMNPSLGCLPRLQNSVTNFGPRIAQSPNYNQ